MWLWPIFWRLMQNDCRDFQNRLDYRGRSWLASLWKEILVTPGYKERPCLKNHKIRKYLGCILRFDSLHTLFHGILSCRTNHVSFLSLWKLYKNIPVAYFCKPTLGQNFIMIFKCNSNSQVYNIFFSDRTYSWSWDFKETYVYELLSNNFIFSNL